MGFLFVHIKPISSMPHQQKVLPTLVKPIKQLEHKKGNNSRTMHTHSPQSRATKKEVAFIKGILVILVPQCPAIIDSIILRSVHKKKLQTDKK